MSEWGFETRAIHSGHSSERHNGATTIPIYETAAFAYSTAEELAEVFDGKRAGHIYSRISNPTVQAFELKMSALEKGVGALATASGMAAIATILFALCRQNDEIVSSSSLFGGTLLLFNKIFKKYGVGVHFVDPLDLDLFRKAVSSKTSLIFLETISNPKLDVPDIGKIAELAREKGVPLVVDSTLTTPYLFKARDFGASLVVHSNTKYIAGNGSTIGGVVVDTGIFDWKEYRDNELKEMASRRGSDLAFLSLARSYVLQNTGSCLSPVNAYLHSLGLETLALRMERHCSNALALSEFLAHHPKIVQVNYPGLKSSPHFAIARLQYREHFGGLLNFRLGSKDKCYRLINNLKLVQNAANLGDAKTLIIHPASTIYHDCSQEERIKAGVSEDLVRVSVGIETIEDIIEDFDQALKEVR